MSAATTDEFRASILSSIDQARKSWPKNRDARTLIFASYLCGSMECPPGARADRCGGMITINVTMSAPARQPVVYPEVHIDSAALEAAAHAVILIHFYRARRRDGMTRIEAARSTGLLIKSGL